MQATDILDLPAMPVAKVMRQTSELPVLVCHQRRKVPRVRPQEAREGRGMDLIRDRGLVDLQLAGPKSAPLVMVLGPQGADGGGHAEVASVRSFSRPNMLALGNRREILTMRGTAQTHKGGPSRENVT